MSTATASGNKIIYITNALPYQNAISFSAEHTGSTNTIVVTNRNLIDFSQIPASQTVNGLKFTNNGVDGITVNGTSSADDAFIEIPLDVQVLNNTFWNYEHEYGPTYELICLATSKDSGDVSLVLELENEWGTELVTATNESEYYGDPSMEFVSAKIKIGVEYSGTAVSNEVIKPMIFFADDWDSTLDFTPGTRSTFTYGGTTKPYFTDTINCIYSTDSDVADMSMEYTIAEHKLFNTADVADIAEAIRSKRGSLAKYKVSEMASAIADIPTGGEWELEFFDYLTLDGGTGCKVAGTLQANNSYYIRANNTSVVAATIHPILRTPLSDWTNWVSVYVSGLRYYFGNNNGASVGGDSANWSQLLGEHDYFYNGSGNITIDNGSTLSTYQYSNVSNSNVSEFIIGGNVGGSNSYHGQIEEFTIAVSGNNIHHYVPCGIKHNGVLVDSGLYDTVTDKYYTSSGTATNTKLTS